MIELPALEYHVAHTCNLSCEQCSHYSSLHPSELMPTPEEITEQYALWSYRPRRFAILGGEPTLNPRLFEHVRLAREAWPDSDLMLVSNGLLLCRHPELPRVLVETNFRLDVSQHGTAPRYMKQFAKVKRLLWRWRAEYPGIRIKIRKSHRGWMRQYRVVDRKPIPFESDPAAAYRGMYAEELHAVVSQVPCEMSSAGVLLTDGEEAEFGGSFRMAALP